MDRILLQNASLYTNLDPAPLGRKEGLVLIACAAPIPSVNFPSIYDVYNSPVLTSEDSDQTAVHLGSTWIIPQPLIESQG